MFHSDFKKIFGNLSAHRDKRSGGVEKKMNSNAETELAPLRSLDDFILSQSRLNLMHILSEINLHPSSRFQVPEYQNVDKFRNRIVSNLIYYQTNYALSSVLLFCLITFMNPFKMFLGMSTMTICNQL